MHGASFKTGFLLNLCNLRSHLHYSGQNLSAPILMGQFPAPESNSYLATVSGLDETQYMTNFCVKIIIIGLGSDLDLLDLDFGLFFLASCFFFCC